MKRHGGKIAVRSSKFISAKNCFRWMNKALLVGAFVFPSCAAGNDGLFYLRSTLQAQEVELRRLSERLVTQEALIGALQEEIQRKSQSAEQRTKVNVSHIQAEVSDLGMRLAHLENEIKGIVGAFKDLEGVCQRQSKNAEHLEKSLNLILEAQGESPESYGLYRVAAGDNLEKIARKHKTTTRALKELNQLETDIIFSGQKLKVPKLS